MGWYEDLAEILPGFGNPPKPGTKKDCPDLAKETKCREDADKNRIACIKFQEEHITNLAERNVAILGCGEIALTAVKFCTDRWRDCTSTLTPQQHQQNADAIAVQNGDCPSFSLTNPIPAIMCNMEQVLKWLIVNIVFIVLVLFGFYMLFQKETNAVVKGAAKVGDIIV